jgi:ribosomal protein S18 acetylase RimI-like enzyme
MNVPPLLSPTESISIVVAAFRRDPAVRWMLPDDAVYDRWFPRFVEAFAGAAFAHDTVLSADGGTALWLPPGAGPDEEALGAVIQECVPEARHADVFALFEEMGRRHPEEPHWYLPMIGVEPDRQGAGLGTRLMREGLGRCHRDGLPAYLESTNPRNIPFYERLGFRRAGRIQAGGCPPIVPMIRPPQKMTV